MSAPRIDLTEDPSVEKTTDGEVPVVIVKSRFFAPSSEEEEEDEIFKDGSEEAPIVVYDTPSKGKKTLKMPPKALTKLEQYNSYCGNHPALVKLANEKYGAAGVGGMSTRQIRAFFTKHPEDLPEHLREGGYVVDHVVPDVIGGQNFVFNYFLMSKEANFYFGAFFSLEKRQYIGMSVWSSATAFSTWCAQKARATIPFGAYDPVSDYFLAKRSR